MKNITILLLLILLYSCSNSLELDSDEPKASEEIQLSFVPTNNFSKTEIVKYVIDIDSVVLGDNIKVETNFGIDDLPCEIVKFYQNDTLIKLTMGCGDCTPWMTEETYYFKNKALILFRENIVDYGYSPCWTVEECIQYGISEEEKEKRLKTRTDEYNFGAELFFMRSGDFNDTTFASNDTLTKGYVIELLEDLIKFKEE